MALQDWGVRGGTRNMLSNNRSESTSVSEMKPTRRTELVYEGRAGIDNGLFFKLLT